VLAEPDLLPLLLPSFRADYLAAETYVTGPEVLVRADIVALAGAEDADVGVEEVAAWRGHTEGSFELRVMPGGHFFLFDHEPEIARAVTDRCLAAVIH
jgi:surfactin synthase thioesterase subunit